MRIDHKVDFRAYETLLARVMSEREKNRIDHFCDTNFRAVVERYVTVDPADRSRPLLVLFDHEGDPFFDRIKFEVHVNRGLWEEAGYREPLACFQLLHEIAHVLMHRNPISSFSSAQHSRVNFAQDEESAEWQANVFAALFMAPPYLAIDCHDRSSFLERFNFPSEFVDFWFDLQKRRPLRFISEFCPRCGAQSLAAIGSRLKCTTCGRIKL
jgi:ribosomal protein S27AE